MFVILPSIARFESHEEYGYDPELSSHHKKATDIKKEITSMRKALNAAYNVEGIVKYENEIKSYKIEADRMEQDIGNLQRVGFANEKALKELDADPKVTKHFRKGKSSLVDLRQDLREKQNEMRELEKSVKDEHSQIVIMEEKCRKVSQLLRDHNRGAMDTQQPQQINENDIEQLQREIKTLEKQKVVDEATFKEQVRQIKSTNEKEDHERNLIMIKVKEKEQEGRLNELKIKQLARKIPHKTLRPLHQLNSHTQYNSHAKSSLGQYTSRVHPTRNRLPSMGKAGMMHQTHNIINADRPKENNGMGAENHKFVGGIQSNS